VLKTDNAGKPEKKQILRSLGFLFNIGWFVALSLVIPTAIGLWLDAPERLNTRPLCTLIGFGLGTIIAGYGLYSMLHQFMNEQKNMDKIKNTDKGAGQ
jgi:hypothetical protein